mgnify:FL=1
MPLGMYCRSRPLVFSLVPRCQGLRRLGDAGIVGLAGHRADPLRICLEHSDRNRRSPRKSEAVGPESVDRGSAQRRVMGRGYGLRGWVRKPPKGLRLRGGCVSLSGVLHLHAGGEDRGHGAAL